MPSENRYVGLRKPLRDLERACFISFDVDRLNPENSETSTLNSRFFRKGEWMVKLGACGQARTALYSRARLNGFASPSRLRRLGLPVTIAGATRASRPAENERDYSRTHSFPRCALLRVRRF